MRPARLPIPPSGHYSPIISGTAKIVQFEYSADADYLFFIWFELGVFGTGPDGGLQGLEGEATGPIGSCQMTYNQVVANKDLDGVNFQHLFVYSF